MKYAVAIASGATIYTYIPNFIKIGSGIQKLTDEGYSHTESMVIS
jgi:hypothetical protein